MTIKSLTPKILQYSIAPRNGAKSWARDIAKDMMEYCSYLQDVLNTFPFVTVQIERQRLLVHYPDGNSSICLDEIYIDLLLPEVEQILNQHNKQLQYNNCKQAAL